MRMSDVISHLGLAVYPIAGMVMFLSVFVGVLIHVTSRGRKLELDGAAFIPLADDGCPASCGKCGGGCQTAASPAGARAAKTSNALEHAA